MDDVAPVGPAPERRNRPEQPGALVLLAVLVEVVAVATSSSATKLVAGLFVAFVQLWTLTHQR
jgi:hypothetical protein